MYVYATTNTDKRMNGQQAYSSSPESSEDICVSAFPKDTRSVVWQESTSGPLGSRPNALSLRHTIPQHNLLAKVTSVLIDLVLEQPENFSSDFVITVRQLGKP
ncbi:hypothetical protein Bbelb_008180 [Branchiostoma belcheri]|nr:hypothetical protein Bbelb_008180 [Branchiostoma belcheri]